MEKEERSQRTCKTIEPELFLQWGNRKRLRCVRVKDPQKISHKSNAIIRRRITSRLLDKESSPFEFRSIYTAIGSPESSVTREGRQVLHNKRVSSGIGG
ncbi:hypothetical protein Goarm_017207 [Gossypium armourianum]|uniref:Uncharacterized protein n=1 Tax=Gossypium armourianum TaxID=34283 RepID=A0A7J9JG03_9ROSI|nr:hypothetical protein [Gossypium armourianum]